MAKIEVINESHKSPEFIVSDLDYSVSEYWHFFFFMYQDGELVARNYFWDFNESNNSFSVNFDNSPYYGYNMFSPQTRYTVTVIPMSDYEEPAGEEASVTFTTSSISSPNGTYSPKHFPMIRDQETYDNCVAQSLSVMLELNRYMNNSIAEHYSVGFIYGSDDDLNTVGMNHEKAIRNVASYGSPRWELVSNEFPDNCTKEDAQDIFDKRNDYTYVKYNASNQKFNYYVRNIDFYDTSAVAAAIKKSGGFMFNFRMPDNFNDVDSSGIVPQPDTWSGVGHSMQLIGWKTINGVKHWIAQNSWGDGWGDGGLCYIPYNWGCDVPAPTVGSIPSGYDDEEYWERASWTWDCYAPYFTNTISNPYPPEDLSVTQVGTTTQLNITWYDHSQTAYYMVMVRPEGSDEWTHKSYVRDSGTTTIDVEEYDTFEVVVISLNNSYACSEWSDIYTITITESGEDPGGGGEDPGGGGEEEGRPTDFEWTYEKESGGEFNLTAEEWEEFCDKIMAFLVYTEEANTQIGSNSMGLSTKTTYYEMIEDSYDTAIKGEPFTAEAFNYARYVIDQISTSETGIALQEAGDTIFADYLNDIVDSLNAIK